MVEQNRSGTLTEIVYTPTGQKFALMNGATLQKAFIQLPGSGTAVYTSAGLDHYRHNDWLGSNRVASSPSRTVLSTLAYAPFGETYAWSGTPDKAFTGQNSDTTPGDYDFLYREYSNQGRWASADPAGLSVVDLSDPRSWNRYAYVSNSALRFTDPFGLFCNYLAPDGEVRRQDFSIDQANCQASGGTWVPPSGNDSYLDCFPGAICIDATDKTPGPDADLAANWRPDYERHFSVAEYDDLHGRFKPTLAYTFSLVIPWYYGFGPAINISYVPSQKLLCAGGGAGASLGHSLSIGAVVVDANHTRDILGGSSLSGGYNLTFLRGAQGSMNANGSTGGFSLGIPGLSASTTYSGCHNY